jgi:hypothetical protein
MKLTQTFLLTCAILLLSAASSHAATLFVDMTGDSATATACTTSAPNDCSLRGAIASAAAGDTVTFDSGLFMTPRRILLTNGELLINKDLTINGVGGVIIDANNASRVLTVSGGAATQINLNALTITGGNSGTNNTGGGINKSGAVLTLTNVTISGNNASGTGGGIFNAGGTLNIVNSSVSDNSGLNGGGIAVSGFAGATTVNISGSTIAGNIGASLGGGVFIQSPLSTIAINLIITNSAIVANSTGLEGGGGFFDVNNGTISLTNVTVSSNRSEGDGGGVGGAAILTNVTIANNFARGTGGGIDSNSAIIRNSIVADNSASGGDPDISGVIVSQGYNIVRNRGASSGYDTRDLSDGTNPLLDVLKNNSGLSATYALLSGSPAINAGNNAFAAGPNDQRGAGFTRIVGTAVDIGAFEAQGATAASVNVGGRVLTETGGGVANAQVIISNAQAGVCFANTNPFGFYRFNGVPAGETYVFDVRSKRFSFSPQVLTVFDDANDLNFTAQPKP